MTIHFLSCFVLAELEVAPSRIKDNAKLRNITKQTTLLSEVTPEMRRFYGEAIKIEKDFNLNINQTDLFIISQAISYNLDIATLDRKLARFAYQMRRIFNLRFEIYINRDLDDLYATDTKLLKSKGYK